MAVRTTTIMSVRVMKRMLSVQENRGAKKTYSSTMPVRMRA